MAEQSFNRSIDALKDVYGFAEALLTAAGIADEVRQPVHLALEELFVNLVTYNTAGKQDIHIALETEGDRVSVTITDVEAEDFDVTVSRDVDIKASLKEREPGGLGLHLIQHMVDTLEYDHRDRRTRIRFTKGPREDDV